MQATRKPAFAAQQASQEALFGFVAWFGSFWQQQCFL
jgi:hypothetical protein